MKFKHGVYVRGMCPEMLFGLSACESVLQEAGYPLTVTSGVDGRHSSKSLHYTGRAVDIRTRDIPSGLLDTLTHEMRLALPADFELILESNHWHLEYDARGALNL